jgi:hypothetical protein
MTCDGGKAVKNHPAAIKALFTQVCTITVVPDGIAFDPTSIQVDAVREDRKYQGVRVKVAYVLDGSRE